jgi:sugar lactone lactonase YvrE
VGFGLALDSVGNLFYSDPYAGSIREITTTGSTSVAVGTGTQGFGGASGPATSFQLYNPEGLAFDSTGNLYIADTNSQRIFRLGSDGNVSTFAGNGVGAFTDAGGYSGDGGPATGAELNFPQGIAFDSSDNLYVADSMNGRIRVISRSGTISTVAGDGSTTGSGSGGLAVNAGIGEPAGVALDNAGNLYIAESNLNTIGKVTPAGYISGLATTAWPPAGIVVSGNNLLAAGTFGQLASIPLSGFPPAVAAGNTQNFTYTGDGGPAISATLPGASGLAADRAGNIYVSDGLTAIRKLTPSAAPPLSITVNSLPGSYSGGAGYSAALTASGGTPSYTWSIPSTALPPGLALNSATGQISGTPTSPGVYNFTATVTDSGTVATTGTPAQAVSQNYSIVIVVPPPTVTSISPPGAVRGSGAVNATIAGTNFDSASTILLTPPTGGNPITITPSLIQAAQLAATIPAALLTTIGTAQVAVTNSSGITSNQLAFNIATPLSVTQAPLPYGISGTGYSATLAQGGTTPYLCTVTTGSLPAGIALNQSTCVLSGIPTATGSFPITVGISDSSTPSQSATQSYTLIVASPLMLTPSPLTTAFAGKSYSVVLAQGGTPPYTCAGTVPAGLTLTSATCTLSGAPTASGQFSFTLNASDSGVPAQTASQTYALAVQTTTQTSLAAPTGPATFGQPVALKATVTPSTVSGNVTFYDGVNIIGIATAANGQASFSTTLLGAGAHTIFARYDGNPTTASSVSSAAALNVKTLPQSGLQPARNVYTYSSPGSGFDPIVTDLNNDGKQDLVVGGSTGAQVLLGNGDGTFTVGPTCGLGSHSAVGDFNGDGIADIAVNGGTSLYICPGNGDGTFQSPPLITTAPPGMQQGTLTAADVNGDGILDLVNISQSSTAPVEVLLGNGDGTFRFVPSTVAIWPW